MKTQLWTARFVPEMIPEWVNPFITIDYDLNDDKYFIFEIDVDDEIFIRCKSPDSKAMRILKLFGFKKLRKVYEGDRSEMFITDSDYPPVLSHLTLCKI